MRKTTSCRNQNVADEITVATRAETESEHSESRNSAWTVALKEEENGECRVGH